MTRSNSLPGCVVAVCATALLVAFASAVSGCGASAMDAATTVTVRAGTALHETDLAVADGYNAAGDRAIAEARADGSGIDGYTARMRPWSVATAALEVARQSWLAMDRALSAYAAGDEGGQIGWSKAAACCVGSLAALTQALIAAGVDVPASLANVTASISGIAGSLCAEGGGQGSSEVHHSPEATTP